MSRVILNIRDEVKADSLINFLKNIDFIEVSKEKQKTINKKSIDAFYESAGIWKNRQISGKNLRKQAWKHGNL